MVGTRGRNATKTSRNRAVAFHNRDSKSMYDVYDNKEEQEEDEKKILQQKTNVGFGVNSDNDDNDDDDNDDNDCDELHWSQAMVCHHVQ